MPDSPTPEPPQGFFARFLSHSPAENLSEDEEQRLNQSKIERFLLMWGVTTLAAVVLFGVKIACGGANGFLEFCCTVLATIGQGLMVAAGMTSVGGFFGFLFGIPNVAANPRPSQPASPAASETPAADDPDDGYQQSVNSNISQISDWLTKTLVGLGLTQISRAPELFVRLVAQFKHGLGDSDSFTLALILNSLILGFVTGYLETRLFLSVAFYLADTAAGRKRRLLRVALREYLNRQLSRFIEQKARVDEAKPELDGMRDMARQLLTADSALGQGRSPKRLFEDAKVLYLADDAERAEQALRKADQLKPNDPDILFYLAYMIIQQDDEHRLVEAATILERVTTMTGAKPAAWKLLGYAYLFVPNKAVESETATQRYLEHSPDDRGAILNLACAYGQQGPAGAGNIERTVQLLRRLIALDPKYRDKVRDLMNAPDGDFKAWKETPGFTALI